MELGDYNVRELQQSMSWLDHFVMW